MLEESRRHVQVSVLATETGVDNCGELRLSVCSYPESLPAVQLRVSVTQRV